MSEIAISRSQALQIMAISVMLKDGELRGDIKRVAKW